MKNGIQEKKIKSMLSSMMRVRRALLSRSTSEAFYFLDKAIEKAKE